MRNSQKLTYLERGVSTPSYLIANDLRESIKRSKFVGEYLGERINKYIIDNT